ncbi:unnamed protein product, partial [marine sediment metagenome]
ELLEPMIQAEGGASQSEPAKDGGEVDMEVEGAEDFAK